MNGQAGARPARSTEGVAERVKALDWPELGRDLDAQGYAVTGPLLTTDECNTLRDSYDRDELFRSRVVMAQHGYGKGEYKYFAYPLPAIVSELRAALYPPLAVVADRWNEMSGGPLRFPRRLSDYLDVCHRAGQMRPTPLLLRYVEGDFNCLHQDIYGEHLFPLQATVLLSDPAAGFSGGEFALTEQRPRMQSRVAVVPLRFGEAVVFAVNQRPVQGSRGTYRVTMRHGVSPLRKGTRHTLGVIFHDAR